MMLSRSIQLASEVSALVYEHVFRHSTNCSRRSLGASASLLVAKMSSGENALLSPKGLGSDGARRLGSMGAMSSASHPVVASHSKSALCHCLHCKDEHDTILRGHPTALCGTHAGHSCAAA